MEGIGILSENLVDASQDLPRRTGEVAACRWVGNEQAASPSDGAGSGAPDAPADQRDRSRAEETLELDPAFVSALTGRPFHADRRQDLVGTFGAQLQAGHLADADPIEQDGGAGPQTRDGTLEAHPVGSPLAETPVLFSQ